jgi:hypothetical protein
VLLEHGPKKNVAGDQHTRENASCTATMTPLAGEMAVFHRFTFDEFAHVTDVDYPEEEGS